MARKPKVVTEAVERLTKLADHLEKMFPTEHESSEIISDAVLVLRELAAKLDGKVDARTRADGSKLNRQKKAKARR